MVLHESVLSYGYLHSGRWNKELHVMGSVVLEHQSWSLTTDRFPNQLLMVSHYPLAFRRQRNSTVLPGLWL